MKPDQRFIISTRLIRDNAIKAIKEARSDTIMEVIYREHKEDKSTEQRGWFHVLCGILGEELGYSQADIKEYAKDEHLGKKTVSIGGVEKEVIRSSEGVKKDEYSGLIEAVYRMGAMAGVVLPPPRNK